MQALNVDLARYDELVSEGEAFDALVESALTEIHEETEFLYRKLANEALSDLAKQAIREFAHKKAFFTVVRDRQEECMNHEYRKFLRRMNEEFLSELKTRTE